MAPEGFKEIAVGCVIIAFKAKPKIKICFLTYSIYINYSILFIHRLRYIHIAKMLSCRNTGFFHPC